MKPLKLEFEGINSFSEHTIIDFEALTKNGIFGIFGDTGSGKSTILDCINFALYGDVERSKEKTDIINYRCTTAHVNFSFNILTEGKRKVYTVDRILKRDKSGTHKAMLYEDDKCIADKASTVASKIVEILGVSDDDFRKCIALPQGEFSQFVKSAPAARLALIERLFSLSKYGDRLKEKLFVRQSAIEGEYQNVSGRLQSFSEVSEEAVAAADIKISESREKLNGLNARLKLSRENCDKLKALSAKRAELDETCGKLSILRGERQKIDELRKGLSVLPDCREVVKISEEIAEKRSKAQSLEKDIQTLENRINGEVKNISDTEQALKDGNRDEKIDACVALAAEYKTCSGKPEKLKALLSELDKKRAEYREIEGERSNLINCKQTAEKEVESVEKQIESFALTDLNGLLSEQIKGTVLKEEYVANLDYFARLSGDINALKDDTPLYSFISGEVKSKIEDYKERVLALKGFSQNGLGERLKALQEESSKREELLKVLSEKKDALSKINSALEINGNRLDVVKRDGEELRARADEIKSELNKVFGENVRDFSAKAEENERELKSLRERKEQLLQGLERAKNNKSELSVSLQSVKTLLQTTLQDCEILSSKLEKSLKSSGFDSVESCVKLVFEFSAYPDAENAVRGYDGQLAALTELKSKLEATEGINEISTEKLAGAESVKAELEAEFNALGGDLAVLEAEKKNLENRLKEKNEILKRFDGVIAERNLLAQLKEVTKNNKFMEFIAGEYLCDVSALASTTLLKLTDGRYFLTYKDNNFFVADNFNCGNLRGVNTLSGGETFLVSLSLALALSQTICAKSQKSIEFFFLDEGFGTLDSTLVDTVMSALEKLKSSNFTIGVISHVEELKHRIDSKITVIKATESHGSTVQTSC
ncbi:MAG: SMC family ATPase [Clostridia bacterium]|nr:SMC family ATPase [Clostridia bacterium]